MSKFIDMTGVRVGRWKVIRRTLGEPLKWDCRCECGREDSFRGQRLLVLCRLFNGHQRSGQPGLLAVEAVVCCGRRIFLRCIPVG